MAEIKCVDVSEWQGIVDWKKVKSAGYSYGILRAGFGRSATQEDAEFDRNYKNAKAAGVKLGVYWYSYAVDKAGAVKEAKACLEVIKGKTFELPVFYDMEENSMTKLGKSTLTAMAVAFCEEIAKAGFRPGVYGNINWFTNYLDYNSLKKKYPIWLAQYHTQAQMDCDIWQYSSKGKVNGITGNVDMNIIYNSAVIKSAGVAKPDTAPVKSEIFENAAVQALLRQAYAQGICKTFVKPIDNKKGTLTNTAIVECRTALGYKNPDSNVDLDFIVKLEHLVNVKRQANFEKARGDFNKDGRLDIRDATEIQKKLAGITQDE